MNARSVNNIINKGGTILKSARSKEFRTKEGRDIAFAKAKEQGLDAIVVIGGDGSFTGAMIFSEEFDFPVMGIPGTIDNDIYGTSSYIRLRYGLKYRSRMLLIKYEILQVLITGYSL